MAKKAFVYDGTNWVDIAQSTADLTNYANMTTTPISGFRNAIINGDFRINQRNFTSITADGTFGFDRWRIGASGGTTTHSSVAFTPGNAISGYEPTNHARLVSSGQSTADSYSILLQPIEGVRTFAGQTITISFWAKTASGTPKVAVELDQQFGTGGSSRVTTYVNQFTLSTSWTRYSVTTTVPSISGKTIGADNYFGLFLWTSAGSNFNARTGSLGIQSTTIDFWGVQVEAGSIATPFEQRPIGTELALCQRYYWQNQASNFLPGILDGGSANYPGAWVTHPVNMRATPVGTFLTIGLFYYNNAGETSFTPAGGTAGYQGDNISGRLYQGAISNAPGSTHAQKSGQWGVKLSFNAEL